jgi:4-oxalocrotonate tautomerase
MPYINCRVMEGVLDDAQKAEIATRITDTFADVVGEPVRGLTWVVIDDIASGKLTIGGDAITTEGVRQVLGAGVTVASDR